uniref:Uncharacterized protein n=1 Tax=Branchiostoma floridae TaxID=7739 RepID=C3YLX4_BRAFL|eukprot:XP_002602556.1 hypothetical protein BRAFLDRAFT_127167 [Branchiostoma floridae]
MAGQDSLNGPMADQQVTGDNICTCGMSTPLFDRSPLLSFTVDSSTSEDRISTSPHGQRASSRNVWPREAERQAPRKSAKSYRTVRGNIHGIAIQAFRPAGNRQENLPANIL